MERARATVKAEFNSSNMIALNKQNIVRKHIESIREGFERKISIASIGPTPGFTETKKRTREMSSQSEYVPSGSFKDNSSTLRFSKPESTVFGSGSYNSMQNPRFSTSSGDAHGYNFFGKSGRFYVIFFRNLNQ